MKVLLKYLQEITFFKLTQFCLKVLLIIFPFQIQKIIYRNEFFNGDFNHFTNVFFGVSDLLIILAIIFFAFAFIFDKNKEFLLFLKKFFIRGKAFLLNLIILFLALFLIILTFWAKDKTLHFLFTLRILELMVLYFFLSLRVLSFEKITKYLLIGGLFQCFIAWGQFLNQNNLGLKFLGEVDLGKEVLNTAKLNSADQVIIRPYGTFSHANILGGYLFVLIGFLIAKLRNNFWKYFPVLILFLITLLISFSRSAWLGLTISLATLFCLIGFKLNLKKTLLIFSTMFFLMILFDLNGLFFERLLFLDNILNSASSLNIDTAVTERFNLTNLSLVLFSQNWWGSGLGSFTLLIQQLPQLNLGTWLYQPVHNLYFLLLIEIGLIGFILFSAVLILNLKYLLDKFKLKDLNLKFQACLFFAWNLGFILMALLDHYFLTSWIGIFLLFLLLSLGQNLLEKE